MRFFLGAMGTMMLSLATSARADTDCQADDATIRAFSPSTADEYIHQQLSGQRYTCAVPALRIQAIFRSSLDGLAGWDSRFALRELVRETSEINSYSPQLKLDLFEAIVSPSLELNHVTRRAEDMVADSHMLLDAARDMYDCSARFELLSLVARINRKLPAGKRDPQIRTVQLELCDSVGSQAVFGGIDALLKLVSNVQGIQEFSDWRGNLARDIHFRMVPDTPLHARQTIQLIEELSDVTADTCQDCGFNWRWRPAYRVALFYHRQQLSDESASVLHQALGMIRAIPNPIDRLAAFKEVCTEMQTERYPDAEYLPLVSEMKPLAASQGNIELLVRLSTNNCVPAGSWADRDRMRPAR
jgi:hypothetical protein